MPFEALNIILGLTFEARFVLVAIDQSKVEYGFCVLEVRQKYSRRMHLFFEDLRQQNYVC